MPRALPAFTVPTVLARIAGRLPQLPPKLALVSALDLALGRVLPRDQLEPLHGKRLMPKVTDAGLALRFSLGARGFRPLIDRGAPDLTISASARPHHPGAARRRP